MMFLVGLWAGRRRLFERVEDYLPLLRQVRTVGLVVGVVGAWSESRSGLRLPLRCRLLRLRRRLPVLPNGGTAEAAPGL